MFRADVAMIFHVHNGRAGQLTIAFEGGAKLYRGPADHGIPAQHITAFRSSGMRAIICDARAAASSGSFPMSQSVVSPMQA